ncbi:uncharacterized protein [Nicotiana sylvestris]|uniref:uncharacterized protein n=1 Tax=Nicotiana sylvestris TaxID=4096 RepID=UPI00388C39DE
MVAPPNFEEGQSTYRPPRFNGQYYGWWKIRMHDFMMVDDSEQWDIICDGPHVPMKKLEETRPLVPKGRREYNDIDRKVVEKNYRSKKILMCGIGPDEYNRVFTSIINELHSLGDVIPRNKLVRKFLSVLPGSWESKTYELKRKKDSERREPKKEKNLVLKAERSDSSDEDSDMAYLTKRFQNMVRRNGGIPKWGNSSKTRNNDLCHRCGKSGHFIKDCPLAKQEQYKQNPNKAGKRNLVPDKRFNRKNDADNIVKQSLAAWGDSSSESERESNAKNSSMMALKIEATKYDSLFALMAQSNDDDEEEEDEDDEVNFRDIQRNLKSYSSKKLKSLSNVLIDAYYSLVNDKEILTIELGEAEQSKDDLVVCVVDLKETIANIEQEKEALNERITSVKNERDDLIVVVIDLKEIIEGLNNVKTTLEEKVTSIEEERDDLLVICTDLEKPLRDSIENIRIELERNQQLQVELEKVRNDLEKSLKWIWSSDVVTAMYLNNSGNK